MFQYRLNIPHLATWVLSIGILGLTACAPQALPPQRSYPSADAAVSSLVQAVVNDDRKAIIVILGDAAEPLISSGDPVQDQKALLSFLAAYDAKRTLQEVEPGKVELRIGPEDWPLPIPIVRTPSGWMFDSTAGVEELINRRIGRNELMTIRTLLSGVAAQQDYFQRMQSGTGSGVYAQRILSTPGSEDGLYWEAGAGEAASPLGPLVDQARDEGYPGERDANGQPIPYHGYFFRILTAQGPHAPGGAKNYVQGARMSGGFAFLAWPAEYGSTGVVSFIVGPDGVVYQKDLGPGTAGVATNISRFNPDLSWTRVDLQD